MGMHRKPPGLKAISGTDRPDRETARAVPEIKGDLSMPDDYESLKEADPDIAERVLRNWNRKVAVYRQRGQSVVGCEDQLYQYCLIEARINEDWDSGHTPATALMTRHQVIARAFYDDPASQHVRAVPKEDNAFTRNVRRPRSA